MRLLIWVIVPIVVVASFEMWRRRLRNRAPRWVHLTAIGLFITIGVALGYAELRLRDSAAAWAHAEPSNKATVLATGISDAMNANAVAVAATILAAVVLAIGTWLARKNPAGGPVAQLR